MKHMEVRYDANGTPDVNDLFSAIAKLYGKTVTVSAVVLGTDSVNALATAIDSVHSKTVTVTSITNNIVNNSTNTIKPAADGTMLSMSHARALAQGSLSDFPAYGDGRVTIPEDQKALVNEQIINGHSESIVHNGIWSMIPGGAHIANLKKGDMIFSAAQTEALLKYGAIPGHARAYAQGSLSDLSPLANAFSTGFSGTGRNPWNKLNSSSSGSSSSGSSSSGGSSSGGSTAAYRANTNSVNANTSATDSNTKSAKESKSTIDFVKIKLDRLANTFEYAANQITDYVSSAFKTAVLKKQMKIIDKQLTANQEAYDTYMKKANSVGLSEEYKKLVKNGALKIEDIDTSTDSGKKLSENIKDFQSYYESAIECKNTIQELNNKLLELYDTLANMPIEKAEKAIDKLKSKYESLDNVYGAITGGGSTLGHLQDQIKKDNPTLANAQKNLDKATTARNKTKSTRSKASKNLKSATTDVEKTGTNLINANKKQTSSIAKKLKRAAKSTTDKATYNTIARAIREGKPISTKGLKGEALKYAKSYNKSLKQGNTIASKVKAGKTVSTSGMTSTLKAKAKKYNTDAKEKNEAQKEYDKAKKADEKALKKLNTAQDTKNKAYSGSTKEQQILATTNGKKAYVYQNMLLTQETRNLKEQNKQRQSALKQVNKNYNDALKNSNSANASKKSAQKKLLSDKSVTSKLTKKQKAALEAGKKVSSADNQDITWDEHGLLCREFNDILNDYNPCQLKIINHGLYITNDGWKTAKAGVGQFYYFDPKDKVYKEGYGIIADTLVGNLILSSQVGIYNEEKSIEMDKNGIIVTTNTYNKNVFTIKKEITDDEGNITYERQLYIDDNGNIVLGGGASISWDNVIGTDKDGKSNSMSKLFETLNDTLNEKYNYLLNQDDKKAETWYQSGDPSVDWTTADDKKKHIGDLWYDTKNQKTYIYGAKGWEETKTNPPDSVFDKIDGKAQIFVAQPKSPYAVGDLWFNSATSDIMTCVKARNTIGEFDSTEWEKRNKYTDDSTLTDFINNTYTTDIGNIQDQIDGKIETFRQETDPSKDWTTAEDKKKHIGDLWYDTATNETFMYNGTGWSPVAGTVPDEVWGKIDSKCQIFTAQPKPPYNKGDLWFVGSSGDILTCTTARKDGESYVETDWTKQNKYTDDTTANTIKNSILKSTYIDSQWVIAPNIKGGQLLISNKSGTISAQITSEGKLIAKEGEFSGKIVSTSGEIGGFNIDNYSLWSGQNVLGGSGVYISPKYGISCNSSFQVTTGGKLTATDADITGDITATSIYAQDAYYIYNGTQTQNAKVIWCNTTQYEWNPSKDVIDFAIGTKDKAYLDFLTYTLNGHVSREASLCTTSTTSDGAIVRCSSTDGISKVCFLAQTSGVSNVAAVQLRVSATNGCCFMPGEFDDRSYDGKINLGISTNKWKQVYTKDLYVDTIHFTQNNSSMSTASSGGVSGNYIPMTGTSKDSNDYVKSPVTGTVHMKNNNGWDLLNTDGYEVTGIYCNKSNQVIIGDNPYKTIVRGKSIQLGNNDTIINIPYLDNYTSANKYLVADNSGNIGWRSVTQGKTYNLANASTYGVMCLYSRTGDNTDGTMTQAAITEAINNAGGGGSSYYAGSGLYLSGSTFNIGYNSRYSADFYVGSNSNHYAFCPTLANNAGDTYRLYLGGNGGSTHPWYKVVTRDGMQQLSDGRFKIDKCILNDDFYDMYMSLKPTKYKVLHDEDSGIHFGFVAQEVEESLKTVGLDASNCSIVSCDESQSYEGGYVYGLSYNEFIPFNTYMTQKAHLRIDELENEIKKLKQIINSLQGVA